MTTPSNDDRAQSSIESLEAALREARAITPPPEAWARIEANLCRSLADGAEPSTPQRPKVRVPKSKVWLATAIVAGGIVYLATRERSPSVPVVAPEELPAERTPAPPKSGALERAPDASAAEGPREPATTAPEASKTLERRSAAPVSKVQRPHRRTLARPSDGVRDPAARTSTPTAALSPAVEGESVESEIVQLDRAERVIATNPTRALELVRDLEQRHPRSALAIEREVIAILALVAAHDVDAAQARGSRFLAEHGRSIHAPRVRAALSTLSTPDAHRAGRKDQQP